MIIRSFLPVVLATIVLAGCQQHEEPAESPDAAFQQRMEGAANQIKTAQNELFNAGVLNKWRYEPPIMLDDDKQEISIDWDGDAKNLLMKLANDSSRRYYSVGVEAPLPISIDEHQTTFHRVIEDVQSQIGFRAVVSYTLDSITLHYHKPQVN